MNRTRTNRHRRDRKSLIFQGMETTIPRSGRGGRRFKSCHSDQLSSHEKSSWGTIWGTKRSPREHLLCFFKHAANSLKPGHAAYAGDHCVLDVARGLVLLSGLGARALPLWDPRTRRNNLLGGLSVKRTVGPGRHANSPHPSSRKGHYSTAWWSSSFLLSPLILSGPYVAAAS